MAKIPSELQEILDDFEELSKMERNEYLVDFADRFKEVPVHIAERPFDEKHRVPHCESEAFVFYESRDDGTLDFYFAVENPQGVSAKAVCKIMQDAASGKTLEEIKAIPESLVTTLFGKGISMGKGLGLQGIISLVKYFAGQHEKQKS